MAYGDWVIGGISLREFMLSADYSSYDQGKITLRAIAEKEDEADARDRISQIEAIASKNISNTNLLNGSTNVQCSGPKVTLTDGVNTWQGAVHWPAFNEGHEAWRVIEWSIVLEVEFKQTAGASKIYRVPLDAYDNVDYHYGSDQTDRGTNNDEIGYMRIVEANPIRRVEINGSAANLPAWVEVNGERLYWQTTFNGESKGTETLIWELEGPGAITIQSSSNVSPWDTEHNTGFWPQYIMVVFV